MYKYILKSKLAFIYFLLLIFDAINVSLMAWFLKETLDASLSGNKNELIKMAIEIVIFIAFYSLISWFTRTVKAFYISKIMYSIKQDLMKSIINFNIKDFFTRSSADYISVFNNDIKMLEDKYFNSILLMFRSSVILIVSMAIMIYIQPIVSVIAVILSFFPIIIPKFYGKKLSQVNGVFSEGLKKYNRVIDDIFNGFEVVKGYKMEPYILEKHGKENEELEIYRKNAGIKKANADVLTNLIAVGIQFAVFVLSGFFVIMDKISAGDVLAITQLMNKVVNPVFDIIDGFNNIQSVKEIEKNMLEIINKKSECTETRPINEVNKKIILKNITYTYSETDQGLKNISLEFEKGKKYAIVGESGSGKSTLIKLILGYFDNYKGDIYFDDVNIRELSQESIFNIISVMTQRVYMFEDTIKHNITLHKNYLDDELENIILMVGLDKTLAMKESDLTYFLKRNGENLSGGERQKVAIARALLNNKKWLVFDEATAGLDNEALYQIENLIVNLPDITCLTITHRYNHDILSKYDKIFVMKEGELVESGRFDELMSKKGIFYNLYSLQT